VASIVEKRSIQRAMIGKKLNEGDRFQGLGVNGRIRIN
jgi:hypothetical protein